MWGGKDIFVSKKFVGQVNNNKSQEGAVISKKLQLDFDLLDFDFLINYVVCYVCMLWGKYLLIFIMVLVVYVFTININDNEFLRWKGIKGTLSKHKMKELC
jgi:hypothetical protein